MLRTTRSKYSLFGNTCSNSNYYVIKIIYSATPPMLLSNSNVPWSATVDKPLTYLFVNLDFGCCSARPKVVWVLFCSGYYYPIIKQENIGCRSSARCPREHPRSNKDTCAGKSPSRGSSSCYWLQVWRDRPLGASRTSSTHLLLASSQLGSRRRSCLRSLRPWACLVA